MSDRNSFRFSSPRRVALGRAASPPTWAWYEQIPYDDESCSSEEDDSESSSSEENSEHNDQDVTAPIDKSNVGDATSSSHDHHEDAAGDMDLDGPPPPPTTATIPTPDSPSLSSEDERPAKDLKGKGKGKQTEAHRQRELEREERKTRQRAQRRMARAQRELRPILTIHKSQGFVWNQDLFVPPYMKDRYVASTSPQAGFVSSSVSSTNSALAEYEPVEIIEIRVREGDLDNIIP